MNICPNHVASGQRIGLIQGGKSDDMRLNLSFTLSRAKYSSTSSLKITVTIEIQS
jgi:hypothetical protein